MRLWCGRDEEDGGRKILRYMVLRRSRPQRRKVATKRMRMKRKNPGMRLGERLAKRVSCQSSAGKGVLGVVVVFFGVAGVTAERVDPAY